MRIVAGKFRGKQLSSPSDDSIRPTSDRAREVDVQYSWVPAWAGA